MPIVATCDHCSAKLKLQDDSLVGRKARCPKCQETFVITPDAPAKAPSRKAKAPVVKKKTRKAPPQDDFLGGISEDDYGDLDDNFEEVDAAPIRSGKKKSSGKKKGKKRKSSSGGFAKIALIILGIVVGLGGLGTAGFYGVPLLLGMLNSTGGRMAWLPDDSTMFMEIKVADVWKSSILSPVRDGDIGQKIKAELAKDGTATVEDIHKIVIGGNQSQGKPIVVVYANKRIDPADMDKIGPASEYGGYSVRTRRGEMVFMPSPKVVVTGPEALVKKAIDNKGVCAAADKFGFLPSSGDLIFATTDTSKTSLPPGVGIDVNKLKSMSMVLNFGTDIDAKVSLQGEDSEFAAKLLEEFNTQIEKGKTQFAQTKNNMPNNPMIDSSKMTSLMASVEQVMNSISAQQSGSSVTVTTTIPGSIIKDSIDMFSGFLPAMLPNMTRPSRPPVFTPGSRPSSFSQPPASPASSTPTTSSQSSSPFEEVPQESSPFEEVPKEDSPFKEVPKEDSPFKEVPQSESPFQEVPQEESSPFKEVSPFQEVK